MKPIEEYTNEQLLYWHADSECIRGDHPVDVEDELLRRLDAGEKAQKRLERIREVAESWDGTTDPREVSYRDTILSAMEGKDG